jgi:competence protein ComEC
VPHAREAASAVWRGPSRRLHAAALFAALGLVAAAPVVAMSTGPDGLLHVHFLDVGQGDATLIVTPAGGSILVDGGPDPRVTIALIDARLGEEDRVLDVAALTHPHADHLSGLMELVRRGRVRRVLVPPLVDADAPAWRDELGALGVEVVEARSGTVLRLSDGLSLEVLNPPDPPYAGTASDVDNNGLVVRVAWRDASLLLPGDLFADGEALMLARGVDPAADVLKLGHHGSDTSTSAAFLRAVGPSMAVLSYGEDNAFGHPADDVVERVRTQVGDGPTLATAVSGSIELTTDGERWWLETER